MSKTYRSKWYNPYRHDPSWNRRKMNKHFRRTEKVYFQKFGETLTKSKERGWNYW